MSLRRRIGISAARGRLSQFDSERGHMTEEIKTRRRRRGNFKICSGPSHREGILLPLTDFYYSEDKRKKYSTTQYYSSQCRQCHASIKNRKNKGKNHGYIYRYEILPYYKKLKIICGSARKAADFSGVGYTNYKYLLSGKYKRVHKTTALKIILALREAQNNLS